MNDNSVTKKKQEELDDQKKVNPLFWKFHKNILVEKIALNIFTPECICSTH